MRIAVINETSAADKNADIIKALEGFGHEILNIGMKEKGASPELQYTHTGFLAGLMLNSGRADLVIGGCGTGQGFVVSASQYPGVFCGHIQTPLDGWLFTQINGGNCISLALNQGYGWAGDVNLKFLFERMFSVESGCGYPAERQKPQQASRDLLAGISADTHLSMAEIIGKMNRDVVSHVLSYPGVAEVLDIDTLADAELKEALREFV